MTAFLKRHAFMAAAGLGVLAMVVFALGKEAGLFGKPDAGGGPGAQAQAGPGKAGAAKDGSGKGAPGGAGKGGGGPPALVVVAPAEARAFSDRVEVPGTALSNESVTITSKVQDVVERVLFESGQYVGAGQALVVLSNVEQSADLGGVSRDVDAAFDDADGVLQEAAAARADAEAAYNEIDAVGRDLEAARASVAEAEAVRNEARLNLGRVQTLAERGFAAPARLDAARAQLQTAEARVRAASERAGAANQRISSQRARAAALTSRAQSVEQRAQSSRSRAQSAAQRAKSVQSRLSDRTIRAPFSGVIGLRTVSPGQLARPGEALATLDDISQIKVDFDVPEARLASVRPGTEVSIRPAAADGQVYRALVRFVDTRIDTRTRSVRARAYVPNGNGALKPGMLMSVNLLSPNRSMPAVPEVALQEEGNQTFVFTAVGEGADRKAKRVPVSVGQRSDGVVEITDGIALGDAVIVEGLVRLRDGQPIRTPGPPGGDGKGPPAGKAPQAKAVTKPQAATGPGGG